MKDIYKSDFVAIPEAVKVSVKARKVTVTGPRGELKKDLGHLNVEIQRVSKTKLQVGVWHGDRKQKACIRTVCSLINNMITGVTKGYLYKMRYVYAHFPINVNITDSGKGIEIRNFLGEKIIRKVDLLEGVTAEISTAQKDELILKGNDVQNVSQSAAQIQQSVLVKNKDIRKFLDGIYVSEKANIVQEE
ncbi:60S ribosomal protein-like protein L9 [Ramicandelaber brevisporus]|nr:60S ribosomal protein-like protein L9 [Ramicandelaber brevisporus]